MNRSRLIYGILILALLVSACADNSDETGLCNRPPSIEIDEIIASVQGRDDGSVSASAKGGTPAYQYSIDGANFQSNNSFTDLAPGTYTVTVKDANGCINTAKAIVREVPEVSYSSQIRPLIDNNCQVTGCHGSNPNLPSWATYNDVKARADRIKFRTGAKEMPPNNPLSDGNIQLIADWVDQGAPNN